MSPLPFSEKLYLSREEREVFVAEEFAQHIKPFQRDGIRFLYRQFSKKNPGAILNDPAAYGKTVQVVLFVNALRVAIPSLSCLILCSLPDVEHWNYHFHLWTDSHVKGVLNSSTNTNSRKDVFVKSISDVSEMARREWGIVVVDDLSSVAHLKQLKSLKADFKIWITNENLLEKMRTLSSICEWINPKHRPDVKLYDKTGLSKKEQVERDVALDIFCQDLVLRRTNECVPVVNREDYNELFETWKTDNTINRDNYFKFTTERSENKMDTQVDRTVVKSYSQSPVAIIPRSSEVSRKNKDATGLKIKRSKNPISQNEESGQSNNLEIKNADHDKIIEDVAVKKPRLNTIEVREHMEAKNTIVNMNEVEEVPKSINANVLSGQVYQDTVDSYKHRVVNNKSSAGYDEISIPKKLDGKITIGNIICSDSKLKTPLERNENSSPIFHSEKNENTTKEMSQSNYKMNNLQSSVKKMEELANKQFKGSILDSLF